MIHMHYLEAFEAISAILASIPDDDLPKFDKVEYRDENDHKPIVWFNSMGHHLGSCTRNGERRPLNYRDSGARQAIEGEMLYRADQKLLNNGDDPTGIKLAKKRSR